MIRRRVTKIPLIIIKVTPTPRTAGAREGGVMKLGGSPFGLGARGTVDGSMPGGRDAIAAVLQVNVKKVFDRSKESRTE